MRWWLLPVLGVTMTLAGPADAVSLKPYEVAVPDAQTAVAVGAAFLQALLGKEGYQALVKYSPSMDGSPLEADLDGDTLTIYARESPLLGKEQHNPDGTTSILVKIGGTSLRIPGMTGGCWVWTYCDRPTASAVLTITTF